mmetsp:Transcript_11600/g.22230  ORF Transcript_11600/g.22230 Transcript_11600/m.22230 type:complete len:120 (+) Transcript_11600:392-751(+)
MARARYQLEQLRTRPQEIYDLRNEEEKQRFAKVSQNTHDSKRHPGKVTKGIAHKDGCLSRKIHRISQNEEQKWSRKHCTKRHYHQREMPVAHVQAGNQLCCNNPKVTPTNDSMSIAENK